MVKGAVLGVVCIRLQRLFAAMHNDPVLDYGAAACVLLTTAADLVVHFGVFLVYPFKLATLCRVWLPVMWYQYVYVFYTRRRNIWISVRGCSSNALPGPKALSLVRSGGCPLRLSRASSSICAKKH